MFDCNEFDCNESASSQHPLPQWDDSPTSWVRVRSVQKFLLSKRPRRKRFSKSAFGEVSSRPMDSSVGEGLPLSEFSEEAEDAIFHFQILKLTEQLYIWIGCNSARLGHLYAAFPTPFDRTPSLTTLIGGGSDSVGASMSRRLSARTGWSIILATNIPSNSPTLETFAEKRLLQELKSLGYVKLGSTTRGAQILH